MQILIVHHCDSWGGAGVSLRDMCRMLHPMHDVTVCLPHLDSEVDKELKKIIGIKTVAIDSHMAMISAYNGGPKFISRTFAKNLFLIKDSSERLSEVLKKEKYDLVMLNSITLSWAAKVISEVGIPSIMCIRETKVNNPGYYMCKNLIDKYCSGIIYISEFDKKTMGSKIKNQIVIKDCFDIEDYTISKTREEACEKFGLDSQKFNILYVGGMNELKGYSVIKATIMKLSCSEIDFVLAGSIDDSKKINAENVKYVGKVFDMPLLYRACDVLVFPSTKGHQARPAFEAGAMGLPVIISDFPETADEVKDGENGLTFEPCNSDALAECIKKLVSDRELAIDMGKMNYENAIKNHEIKSCGEQLIEFCEEINK